jgi:hypothetical protein
LIERWFRELSDKPLHRGVFRNLGQLIAAIKAFIAEHNEHPRSFVWTAKVDDIIAKGVAPGRPWIKPQLSETHH